MDTPDSAALSDRSDNAGQSDPPDRSDKSEAPMLSVAEAAAHLGVNERTVRRYIKRGILVADRRRTERHTMELRIAPAALADFLGRRDAIAPDTGSQQLLKENPR